MCRKKIEGQIPAVSIGSTGVNNRTPTLIREIPENYHRFVSSLIPPTQKKCVPFKETPVLRP